MSREDLMAQSKEDMTLLRWERPKELGSPEKPVGQEHSEGKSGGIR